jgi:hypothetical protein
LSEIIPDRWIGAHPSPSASSSAKLQTTAT